MTYYEITFTKPNNIIRTGEQVQTYTTRAEVNAFVRRAKEYPGSYQIVSIVKVAKTGVVTQIA